MRLGHTRRLAATKRTRVFDLYGFELVADPLLSLRHCLCHPLPATRSSFLVPRRQSINAGWDLRRTLKQNYDAMGLSTNPNIALPIKKGDKQRKEEQADREVPVTDSEVMRELTAVQNQEKPAPYQVRVSARGGEGDQCARACHAACA